MSLHIDTNRETGKFRLVKEGKEGVEQLITGLDEADLDGIRSMIDDVLQGKKRK